MTTETPALASRGNRTAPTMHVRLDVMMFLQYFVQGAYLPVLSVYLQAGLGYTPNQMAIFIGAMAIGPFIAPFIIGQLVDRHFASQHVLAACHFLSGAIMLALYFLVSYSQAPFAAIVVLAGLYSALYIPSMMVSNSLAFHHLKDRERDFPLVRLFGTIGFIVPAWLVELVFLDGLEGAELNSARGIVLAVSGWSGIAMGIYSLTLPHTPAHKKEQNDLAPGKVVGLLRQRNFLLLVGLSLIIAVAHKFFFVWNSPYLSDILLKGDIKEAYEQRISSVGQFFEILVMIVLGLSIKRLGFKKTMLIGAGAYFVRCLILAYAITLEDVYFSIGLACVGQALHGVCFACFLATAFMYVDRISPADVRGSMQNFYGTFIISLGMFVGSFVSGGVGELFTTDPDEPTVRATMGIASEAGVTTFEQNIPGEENATETKIRDWPGVWLSGAAIALIGLIGLAILFPKDTPIAISEAANNSEETASSA